MCLRSVFEDRQSRMRNIPQPCRHSVQMHWDLRSCPWGFLVHDLNWINVEIVQGHINEYRLRAYGGHGNCRCCGTQCRNEHLITRPDTQCSQANRERVCSRADPDTFHRSTVLRKFILESEHFWTENVAAICKYLANGSIDLIAQALILQLNIVEVHVRVAR